MKNTHGGVLWRNVLAYNITKTNILPWVFFAFLKINQMETNCAMHHIFRLAEEEIRLTCNGLTYDFHIKNNSTACSLKLV